MVELVGQLRKLYIFNKELGLAGCPPILPFGVGMVGPVIYTFGNDEQKEDFCLIYSILIHGGVRVTLSQVQAQI